ncbi:MAG: sel1 repeat family protein [Pseudomonadota bacterium]|nr:sel1 repeat family protein [Pseudomonadota bacterium]QKK05604.1 MAG: sel1 repeat family protein [Pseudomonadota bacterium]
MKKLFAAAFCTIFLLSGFLLSGFLLSGSPAHAASAEAVQAAPTPPESASPTDAIEAAANQGDRDAQYTLGTFYMHGHHKQQNHELAEKWLKSAAESGQKDAPGKLGLLYAATPFSDYPEACFWLTLAVHEGDAASTALLEKIRGHLTKQEKAALNERLVQWITTNKAAPAQ